MTDAAEILLECDRFRVERVQRETSRLGRVIRDVIRHPGSVAVVPMVDADHVCLIRNFRLSVDRALWEVPAGTRDREESITATAHRELQEETGYTAREMEPIHQFFAAPGILDEEMYLFLATELVPGSPHREPGEEIENAVLKWDKAIQMVHSGEICDAKTLVALLIMDARRRQTPLSGD